MCVEAQITIFKSTCANVPVRHAHWEKTRMNYNEIYTIEDFRNTCPKIGKIIQWYRSVIISVQNL